MRLRYSKWMDEQEALQEPVVGAGESLVIACLAAAKQAHLPDNTQISNQT